MVKRWRRSGKSQAEYCRKHGIKKHTLSYWANRKSKSGGEQRLKLVELSTETRGEVGGELKYEVALPSGIRIKVGDDVNAEVVTQLASMLEGGR